MGNRLTVDPRTLTPLVQVRILVPQPLYFNDLAEIEHIRNPRLRRVALNLPRRTSCSGRLPFHWTTYSAAPMRRSSSAAKCCVVIARSDAQVDPADLQDHPCRTKSTAEGVLEIVNTSLRQPRTFAGVLPSCIQHSQHRLCAQGEAAGDDTVVLAPPNSKDAAD